MEPNHTPTLGLSPLFGGFAHEAELEYGDDREVDWHHFGGLTLFFVIVMTIIYLTTNI